MVKQILIEVNSKDIEGARRGSISNCPLARAITRKYPLSFEVQAFDYFASINGEKYDYSQNLLNVIVDYDYGRTEFKPATYRLTKRA